jgi:polysaccharide biosynthesis/export protein
MRRSDRPERSRARAAQGGWRGMLGVLALALATLALMAEDDARIGPGDTLKILVLGQPELSGEFTVGQSGELAFPFVGPVAAGDLTIPAFEHALKARLADGFLKQPQVAVSMAASQKRRVFVAGEVKHPGPYTLKSEPSLRLLLRDVGELTTEVGHEVLVIRPPAEPLPEPAPDAKRAPRLPGEVPGAQVLHVSLRDLLAGQVAADLGLEPGDTVYFPKAAQVYVIGHAGRPGAFRFEEGLTVNRLLALAGGVNERGSSKIKLARIVDGKRRELRAQPADLVQPEDTLIVPERFF